MMKQYCIACHSSKLKTAGVSLEDSDLHKVADDADLWEKVLRKLDAKEMPPAGLPHPSAASLKQFTNYLETELDRAAAAHPNPGQPTFHRLNRNEYSNAVRDLLAIDLKPGDSLPLDDTGYGFDNIGDVLSLSPVLVERCMTDPVDATGRTANVIPIDNAVTLLLKLIRATGAEPHNAGIR